MQFQPHRPRGDREIHQAVYQVFEPVDFLEGSADEVPFRGHFMKMVVQIVQEQGNSGEGIADFVSDSSGQHPEADEPVGAAKMFFEQFSLRYIVDDYQKSILADG